MCEKQSQSEITLEGFTIYTHQKIGGPKSEVYVARDQNQ